MVSKLPIIFKRTRNYRVDRLDRVEQPLTRLTSKWCGRKGQMEQSIQMAWHVVGMMRVQSDRRAVWFRPAEPVPRVAG